MLETTGQKPTKKCIECEAVLTEDNWYPSFVGKKHYKCKSCYDERRILNRYKKRYGSLNKAIARLIYVSTKKKYDAVTEGQVYIIRNPAFPSWCKVGMAVDAQDRLKQYQTSSPYRDYDLVKAYNTENRREAEAQAHALLENHYARRGEWFVCDASLAVNKLDSLFEVKQLELF